MRSGNGQPAYRNRIGQRRHPTGMSGLCLSVIEHQYDKSEKGYDSFHFSVIPAGMQIYKRLYL
jgi:hypothetical protein